MKQPQGNSGDITTINLRNNMKVVVVSELYNIAGKFEKAIWRKRNVSFIYNSRRDAARWHNLRNCHYQFIDDDENVIREVNNAKLDGYGRRMS